MWLSKVKLKICRAVIREAGMHPRFDVSKTAGDCGTGGGGDGF